MTSRLMLAAAVLCLVAAPAAAQNWIPLLKNTPAEHFDEEDLKLFLDAARRALNEATDNQTVSWENKATGHRGELTVLRSFTWKDRNCREVGVHNYAGGRKSNKVANACRVDGRWRLVSAAELKKK